MYSMRISLNQYKYFEFNYSIIQLLSSTLQFMHKHQASYLLAHLY